MSTPIQRTYRFSYEVTISSTAMDDDESQDAVDLIEQERDDIFRARVAMADALNTNPTSLIDGWEVEEVRPS